MVPRAQQQRGRDRRDQLLDCAADLFFRKGYEAASIQDLMQAAGVSKGAVYHHFKSKEEVLEALSVRLASTAAASVSEIVADASLQPIEKLNRVFAALRERKALEWPRYEGAFQHLFSAGNAALFHQINHTLMQVMAPLLAEVMQEGAERAVFRVSDPLAVAEMIVQLQWAIHTALGAASGMEGGASQGQGAAVIERRIGQIGVAIDRLLGLQDHTIALAHPSSSPSEL